MRNRLFFSSSFEQLRSRSRRNASVQAIVSSDELRRCGGTRASNAILDLYSKYVLANPQDILAAAAVPPCYGAVGLAQGDPVTVDRSIAMERLDYRSPGRKSSLTARLALSRTRQPDFIASPYRGMDTPLVHNTNNLLLAYTQTLHVGIVNELRGAFSPGTIDLRTPHRELPILQYLYNSEVAFRMPSSTSPIDFGMRGSVWELSDGISFGQGQHVFTAGGSALLRRPRYALSYLAQGLYNFNGQGPFFRPGDPVVNPLADLSRGQPLYYELALDRRQYQGEDSCRSRRPASVAIRVTSFRDMYPITGSLRGNWRSTLECATNTSGYSKTGAANTDKYN